MGTIQLHVTQKQYIEALTEILRVEHFNRKILVANKDNYEQVLKDVYRHRKTDVNEVVCVIAPCHRGVSYITDTNSIAYTGEFAHNADIVFAYNPSPLGGLERRIIACREELPSIPPVLRKDTDLHLDYTQEQLADMLLASFESYVEFKASAGSAGYKACRDSILCVLQTAANTEVARYSMKVLDRIPSMNPEKAQEELNAAIDGAVAAERERCVEWANRVLARTKYNIQVGISNPSSCSLIDL